MKPPEDERIKETVRQLLEVLLQFGDPVKRPGKVIPWPKLAQK